MASAGERYFASRQNPIPFNPIAREALIAEGSNHPELKRHIEAWQEMKRTGSKWATGEWMKEK